MLRQFIVTSLARGAACLVVVTLAACGIKGPLRPATPDNASAAPAGAAPAPPTNPEARPPLLPSEPPSAIVPPEPGKKP